MDFIIVQMGMCREKHVDRKNNGVSVADERQRATPRAEGAEERHEVVVGDAVNFGYFPHTKRAAFGRYTWVKDNRGLRIRRTTKHVTIEALHEMRGGSDRLGEMPDAQCAASEKAEEYDSDEWSFTKDIETRCGVDSHDDGVMETFPGRGYAKACLMMDEFGNAYEAEPMTVAVPTRIPKIQARHLPYRGTTRT